MKTNIFPEVYLLRKSLWVEEAISLALAQISYEGCVGT